MSNQPCIEAPAIAAIVAAGLLYAGEHMLALTAVLMALSLALIYRIQVHHVLVLNHIDDDFLLELVAACALVLILILPAVAVAITS